jgi:hypothetical protein
MGGVTSSGRKGVPMNPFSKPLSRLKHTDIEALIQNGIPESRNLDYKRELYSPNDPGNKEFLCDVSAFANTAGGYLIIGIQVDENDKSIPKTVVPFGINSTDQLIQRYENLLRTAVDPPIRGVGFQPVDVDDERQVLVIEVPRSISRPHAVNHKGHWRFYGRNTSGKYPYEVHDVRRAMLESETLAVRLRDFRNDRLAQINAGETPMSLSDGAKTVLHMLPVSCLELGQKYDLCKISSGDVPQIAQTSYDSRINFDGLVTYYDDRSTGRWLSYVQVFGNGIIEAVDSEVFLLPGNGQTIPSVAYEQFLVEALDRYSAVLVKLGVEFPIWVCLSLLDVKGYSFDIPIQYRRPFRPHLIDRPELILPEIEMADANEPAKQVLTPAFEAVWSAGGCRRPDDPPWLKDG